MRHIRYEKSANQSWIEMRGDDKTVENRGEFPSFSGAAYIWQWEASPYWKNIKDIESYWDSQDGYIKTVIDEGDKHPAMLLKELYNGTGKTPEFNKKHSCICKWEEVYQNGCKCGGV